MDEERGILGAGRACPAAAHDLDVDVGFDAGDRRVAPVPPPTPSDAGAMNSLRATTWCRSLHEEAAVAAVRDEPVVDTVGLQKMKNKMIGYLSSSSSGASAIEIVGDSNPQTLCMRRDERYVCSLSSLPLLGDTSRLVCSGATAPPRGSELLVEHLHPSRLAKQDDIELFCSARARLKCRSTGGRDITP